MHFKNFDQFIGEGLRWNTDKSGALLSLDDRSKDLMSTSGASSSKTGGFGKYVFKVYMGLRSIADIETLKYKDKDKDKYKNTAEGQDLSDLMQRLKQGYFNMVASNEPDHKMTINDIARKAQPDLTEYDEKLFFEFMEKTGKFDKNLKYIVMAESNDVMTTLMAETIQKFTKAEIVKLKKNTYSDKKILKFYKEIPSLDRTKLAGKQLSKFRQDILADYDKYVEEMSSARGKIEKGDLEAIKDILKELKQAESGEDRLKNVLRFVSRTPSVIKGNNLFNHVRNYLNDKYHFDEDFINKVKECLVQGSTSKMLIIDDNIQHGADFREIMNMCGYVADIIQLVGNSTVDAVRKTEKAEKALRGAMNDTQKKKLGVIYDEALVMERTNINNITGYVLYERPIIGSSPLSDTRSGE